MMTLTQQDLWRSLEAHAKTMRLSTLNMLHTSSTTRTQQFSASTCQIKLDYANQRVSTQTLEHIFALANQCALREKIHALMRGDNVNATENRPALHTALRAPHDKPIWVDAENVMLAIETTRQQMNTIAEQIRSKNWLGYSGKPITDIVNIGIGGSDLGPRFCVNALSHFSTPELGYHFISDADPGCFARTTAKLNPETTLFIVSSKSFTTQETLYNAKKAKDWIGSQPHSNQHFIAITAHAEKARQFGITHTLPIWDWIGGRYSSCSAINLITTIAIGANAFGQMLAGAHQMDRHFHDTAFSQNLPVLLALLGIWNNNFLNIHTLLMLSYAQQLELFVPFIQQLEMESNGKSCDTQGNPINHMTCPIIWGGPGNQVQHSYYQLLCQGKHPIAADFITLQTLDGELINQMCTAKKTTMTEGIPNPANLHAHVRGDIPVNHLELADCTPFTMGALIALYEHKVFAQSVIWGVNAFDQPGIERAKEHRGCL